MRLNMKTSLKTQTFLNIILIAFFAFSLTANAVDYVSGDGFDSGSGDVTCVSEHNSANELFIDNCVAYIRNVY